MAAKSKAEVRAGVMAACQLAARNAAKGEDLDAVILEHCGRAAVTSTQEAQDTWDVDHHRREGRRETDVLTFWSFSRRPEPADQVAEHLASSWSPPLP